MKRLARSYFDANSWVPRAIWELSYPARKNKGMKMIEKYWKCIYHKSTEAWIAIVINQK